MIHLVIIGMKLNKLIEEVYSPRIKFKCNFIDNKIDVIDNDNNVIGYIIEKQQNDIIVLEFDLDKKNHNIGLQTEILREYLRYKYLWEEYQNKIIVYPRIMHTKRVLEKRYFKECKDYYYIDKDIYLSHIEKVALFDINFNMLDYPILRGAEAKPGTYQGIVDVIIYNEKNNKYLTTKRDKNKVLSPGKWEFTGGAIDFKEKIEDALIREAFEETGLHILKYNHLTNTIINDLVFFTYLGIVNANENDVKLQLGETVDYKWRTKDELIELYNTDLVPEKQKIRFNKVKDLI